MDAHILKVYVPMTETGFYILLCFREESHGYSVVRKVEELTGGEPNQPRDDVWQSVQDGKGWVDPVCAGGRKAENLLHHRPGPRGAGSGNETDRKTVPKHDGGAPK